MQVFLNCRKVEQNLTKLSLAARPPISGPEWVMEVVKKVAAKLMMILNKVVKDDIKTIVIIIITFILVLFSAIIKFLF